MSLVEECLNFSKAECIFSFMKAKAPPLLPIFRSDTQARILAALFLGTEGQSIVQLSRSLGKPMPTIHREVQRLEEAGLVRSQRVGNVRVVRAEESLPYHDELEALLLKTFGPAVVLGEAIASVSGVDEAYIFGSWARRYHGEAGTTPGDIDLVVVGSPDPDDVYGACRTAEEKLGNAVNPNILSASEWKSPKSGFVTTVKSGPLVPVVPKDS